MLIALFPQATARGVDAVDAAGYKSHPGCTGPVWSGWLLYVRAVLTGYWRRLLGVTTSRRNARIMARLRSEFVVDDLALGATRSKDGGLRSRLDWALP